MAQADRRKGITVPSGHPEGEAHSLGIFGATGAFVLFVVDTDLHEVRTPASDHEYTAEARTAKLALAQSRQKLFKLHCDKRLRDSVLFQAFDRSSQFNDLRSVNIRNHKGKTGVGAPSSCAAR